jgi:hypothetical protein
VLEEVAVELLDIMNEIKQRKKHLIQLVFHTQGLVVEVEVS